MSVRARLAPAPPPTRGRRPSGGRRGPAEDLNAAPMVGDPTAARPAGATARGPERVVAVGPAGPGRLGVGRRSGSGLLPVTLDRDGSDPVSEDGLCLMVSSL